MFVPSPSSVRWKFYSSVTAKNTELLLTPASVRGLSSWRRQKSAFLILPWPIFGWALKNWCFWILRRRLLRIPWTARRWHESILKEINPEYSLEGLMLKLQYFGHLMWRADSLEKNLMLGKIEGRKRKWWQRMRWMTSPTQWTMSLSKLQEIVKDKEAWSAAIHGVAKNQTRLSNWTTTKF